MKEVSQPAARSPSMKELHQPVARSRSIKSFAESQTPTSRASPTSPSNASTRAPSGHPATRARSMSRPKKMNPLDPFNLDRFVEAQKENDSFDRALGEIQAGRKSSCWMWFVIPSPPHMKNNIEHGSCMNRFYAIRSDEEAKAFANYASDGVDLRDNYFSIMSACCEHLRAGKAARSVIGSFDEPKLASSIILFERVTRGEDKELNELLVDMAGLMDLRLAPAPAP
ncbi:unnamed protein product [Effrenium voratum]|nr:unnamed protein product [Effrenium voratum]